MPLLLRTGFAIVGSGLVVDVAYHGLGLGGAAAELAGHVVSLAGMLAVMAGLVAAAVHSHRPSTGAGHESR